MATNKSRPQAGMLSACPDYRLKPGDKVSCLSGFTWNVSLNCGVHIPDYIEVVKEYPSFVVVRAHFESYGGTSYCESINKAAVRGGYCYFRKIEGE